MLSRRQFLSSAAAGAALAATGVRTLSAAEPEKKILLGIQLYSVRGECKKDLVKTIETIGKMGYEGVEFAGYYGWDKKPKEFRKLLDDNGLRCCGTHTAVPTLLGDALKRTADLHNALGNRFLMVPSLPRQYRGNTREKWLATAKLFSDIAEKAKPLGMRVGYHNHSYEFKKLDSGETGWDVFYSNASPDVLMQLDTGNCMGGGGDPLAILAKHGKRAATVHLKEFRGTDGVLGTGGTKWNQVFSLCKATGVTEWYIVEYGGSKIGVFETARRSLDFLKKATA